MTSNPAADIPSQNRYLPSLARATSHPHVGSTQEAGSWELEAPTQVAPKDRTGPDRKGVEVG